MGDFVKKLNEGKIKVEYVEIDKLKPAEYNPRKLTESEERDLTNSIKGFGLVDPIIVNNAKGRENIIIGGHQRYHIAKKIGIKQVPVVYVSISDLKKEQELNLRLNKNLGEWDYDLLANFDEELLKNVGFSDIELTKLIDGFLEKGEIEIEEKEKVENKLNIKYGDIYKLGDSYLICGDANDSKIYENLLNQEKVNMIFADPPYELKENDWFDIAKNYVNGSIFVMHNDKEQVKLCYENMDIFKHFFIVDFNVAIILNTKMAAQGHTLISYFSNAKNKFINKNDCFETVIKYDKLKQMKNEVNKYTKNINLFEKFLLHYTNVNDKVLDIFSGIGTMLLLCEKNKRRCFSIELSQEYCNVIIETYEKNFNKKAKKI